MATTSVPTNARVQLWEREFFKEYIRANRYSKYMGSDESAIIQVNEDLSKKIGESITFELVNRLSGNQNTGTGAIAGVTSGITGYNTLEGNEEALGIRTYKQAVDRTRWAVLHDELDEQYSAIDLVEAKRSTLMDWFKENIRDRINLTLASVSTDGITHIPYAAASAGQRNTWNANNSDRLIYGATTANFSATHSTALATVDTTADTFTAANLSALKDVAKSSAPKIRPIKVNDEEEWYVVFVGTKLFRQIQTSLQSINQSALAANASKNNPLYTGGDLMWDGMIIREVPEIAGLGAVGTSSALVAPAFLCGAQALAYAIARRSKMISNIRDYAAKIGGGTEMIDGIGKVYFGAGTTDRDTPKMNGVAIGFYAYI